MNPLYQAKKALSFLMACSSIEFRMLFQGFPIFVSFYDTSPEENSSNHSFLPDNSTPTTPHSSPYSQSSPIGAHDGVPTLGTKRQDRDICPNCGWRPVKEGYPCPQCFKMVSSISYREPPWKVIALGSLTGIIVISSLAIFLLILQISGSKSQPNYPYISVSPTPFKATLTPVPTTPTPTIHPTNTPKPIPTNTLVPIIGTLYIPANQGKPGTSALVTVPINAKLTITASGFATWNGIPNPMTCSTSRYTDPNGDSYPDTKKTEKCPSVTATGTIIDAPVGTLVGRIGDGPWFKVGSNAGFTSDRAGELYFIYNDNGFADNGGGYNVNFKIQP
jgi:hypothetical protein